MVTIIGLDTLVVNFSTVLSGKKLSQRVFMLQLGLICNIMRKNRYFESQKTYLSNKLFVMPGGIVKNIKCILDIIE